MQLESVNCGNCGAPLQIPESAQYVTCNHCHSSLAVKRTETVTLTEKLERAHERIEETERQLAELVYKNELSEEHRRWEREERDLLVTDRQGNFHKPTMFGGIIFGIFAVFMAVMSANAGFGGFSFLAAVFGSWGFLWSLKKVRDYDRAHRRHQARLSDISQRYEQSQHADTRAAYLKQLESAPTPEEYRQELSRS